MVTRLGIVGFGWVARDYMLPAIQAHPGVKLAAVVSLDESEFVGLPEGVARYTDFGDYLAAGGVDAVYVASPNHVHPEHAIGCLRAGQDVLCEKPLARTYDEAAKMVAAAADSDRLLITAFDQRHHPAHKTIKQWINDGRLGTLTQMRIDYACWLPAGWSADNWRIDPARAGGGAVIDLAPHGLDLLETLSGQTITELHCRTQTAVQDYIVDDGGILTAAFDGGALASLTVAYNRPETLPRRRLELIGTGGMLLSENTMGQEAGGKLTFYDAADGSATEIDFDRKTGPFYGQLDQFINAHRRRDGRDYRESRQDLHLVELLDRALQTPTTWP